MEQRIERAALSPVQHAALTVPARGGLVLASVGIYGVIAYFVAPHAGNWRPHGAGATKAHAVAPLVVRQVAWPLGSTLVGIAMAVA